MELWDSCKPEVAQQNMQKNDVTMHATTCNEVKSFPLQGFLAAKRRLWGRGDSGPLKLCTGGAASLKYMRCKCMSFNDLPTCAGMYRYYRKNGILQTFLKYFYYLFVV